MLATILILLAVVIGGNLRDYNRQKEAELNEIRQEHKLESEQLQQAKEELKDQNEKLKKENERLEKDLQAKREREQVKVASVSTPTTPPRNVIAPAEIRTLVAKYFPSNQVDNALAVMRCESGFNANAVNWADAKITGMPSCGLFQINAHQNWAWNDPEANIKRAYAMWSNRGWQPWFNCSKRLGLL